MSDKIIEAILKNMTPEQKADLLKSLAGSLEAYGLNEKKPVEQKTIQQQKKTNVNNVSENFIVNRELKERNGRNPVRARKNLWQDSGENRDLDFDPERYEKMGKAARNRKKPQKVEVECSVCGRAFMVDEQHVFGEYHRCNRCVRR